MATEERSRSHASTDGDQDYWDLRTLRTYQSILEIIPSTLRLESITPFA